jgi:hypothetical protein
LAALFAAAATSSGCTVDNTPAYHAPDAGSSHTATKGGGGSPATTVTSTGGSGSLAGTTSGAGGDLGASGGGGGSGGDDGTAGAGGAPMVEPPPSVCYPTTPASPLIADFHNTNQTTGISFGDYSGGFSGFSYQYGAGITSDVSTGVWHLTGMVSEYSGFGFGFNYDNSHNADASGYAGVEFTMKGNVGPSGSLTLGVQHGPDSAPTTFSACSKCPGDCGDPTKTFNVGQTQMKISLRWSDFAGGRPQGGVDPKQLLGLIWFFGWNGAGSTPYTVDLTITDVKFLGGGVADAAAE